MVSPMREKRVWPPARKEADAAETVAQFEATVAVAKQTVAKSSEVLASAKEDLSEHQRWLQLQTAAVEKDRVRHERWLQRQRERKEAAERREEARLRRRAFFQRIWAGIKGAVLAVVYAITGAIGFVVRKIVGAIVFVLRSIGRGFAFVGTSIRNFVLHLFRQIHFAGLWLAVKLREVFGAAGAKTVAGLGFAAAALAGFARSAARTTSGAIAGASTRAGALARSTGEAVSSGVSQISAKAGELARSTGEAVASGVSQVSAKAGELARSTGEAVSSGVSQVAAKAGELARSTGEAVASGVSQVSAKAGELARSTGEAVSSGVSQVSAKAQELASQAQANALAREASPSESGGESFSTDQPAFTSDDQPEFAADDQPAFASNDQPVFAANDQFPPVDIDAGAMQAAGEAGDAPTHFRTVAERAEQSTVYQFSAHRPESFFHRENPSEPWAPSEEVELQAFAETPAETETVPQSVIAPERGTGSEILFGAEPRAEFGNSAGSELADRARAVGSDAGAKLAAAFAGVAAVLTTFGRRTAILAAAIVAVVSAKIRALAPHAGERISHSTSAAGASLKAGVSGISAKARGLGQTAARSVQPAFSGISNKVQAVAPAFHALVTQAGGTAAGGIAQVKRLRDVGKNALSLPEGVDRDRGEISRMLIVAGILMLICGALLIGSGLILRTGTPSMSSLSSPFTSEAESTDAANEVDVVWLFDDPERTFEERSVFAVADGATAARLTGLAFNAENWSDHTLIDVHGTVKPDLKIIDFKLAIDLVESVGPMPASPAPDTVPPRTAFRLIVPFPREVMDGEAGVAIDDFLSDYGGLTLKVRYAVDGKEKSYIQYLSPAALKAQLAEIAGSAESLARF